MVMYAKPQHGFGIEASLMCSFSMKLNQFNLNPKQTKRTYYFCTRVFVLFVCRIFVFTHIIEDTITNNFHEGIKIIK